MTQKVQSQEIDINIMQYLQRNMLEQSLQKNYDIVGISELIYKYLTEIFTTRSIKQQDEQFENIIQYLKNIFIFYGKSTITYEQLNDYVFKQSQKKLQKTNSFKYKQMFMEIGEDRIRIDPNVKLCVMPQGDSQRIVEIVIQKNTQNVFVVTNNFVREISVLDLQRQINNYGQAIEVDDKQLQSEVKQNQIEYSYSLVKIKPMDCALGELKMQLPKELKRKVKGRFIQKAAVGKHIIGIITKDDQFIIQPLQKLGQKQFPNAMFQGMIGDLEKDKPKSTIIRENSIVLFENYDENLWLVLTKKYIYLYWIPNPYQTHKLHKNQNTTNPFLMFSQQLPGNISKAILLSKPFIAVMMQEPCILIMELILQLGGKYRITNKIFNDVKMISMCYYESYNYLFYTDFGAYHCRISMNLKHGDIEEQGTVFDGQSGTKINQNITNINKYKQKLSQSQKKQSSPIIRTTATKFDQNTVKLSTKQSAFLQNIRRSSNENGKYLEQNIQQSFKFNKSRPSNDIKEEIIQYKIDEGKKKLQLPLSIYTKQQNTDHSMIVKNSTRQCINFVAVNSNFSTVIACESNSIESHKLQGKQFIDKSTIRLWDMHHMTVYQTIQASINFQWVGLLSNGLYIVTQQRGYLAHYSLKGEPLQTQKPAKNLMMDSYQKQQLTDKLVIQGNKIYFCSEKFTENTDEIITTVYELNMSHHPTLKQKIHIPSVVKNITSSNMIYILNDIDNNELYKLYVFHKMGNHQHIYEHKYEEKNINSNFTSLCNIENHQYFSAVLWNKNVIKLISIREQISLSLLLQGIIQRIICNQRSLLILTTQQVHTKMFQKKQKCSICIFDLFERRISYRINVNHKIQPLLILQNYFIQISNNTLKVHDLSIIKCILQIKVCQQINEEELRTVSIQDVKLSILSNNLVVLIILAKVQIHFLSLKRNKKNVYKVYTIKIKSYKNHNTKINQFIWKNSRNSEQFFDHKVYTSQFLDQISRIRVINYEQKLSINKIHTLSLLELDSYKIQCNLQNASKINFINYDRLNHLGIITILNRNQINLYQFKIQVQDYDIMTNIHLIGKIKVNKNNNNSNKQLALPQKNIIIDYWNHSYKIETNYLWQRSKKDIITFCKNQQTHSNLLRRTQLQQDLGRISQKQQSISQLSNILQIEVKSQKEVILQNKQGQKKNKKKDLIKKKEIPLVDIQSVNQMLRKWNVEKIIEKQYKQNNHNQAQKNYQFDKLINNINQKPDLRDKRIKQLLQFPKIMKKQYKTDVNNSFQLTQNQINNLQQVVEVKRQVSRKKSLRKQSPMRKRTQITETTQEQTLGFSSSLSYMEQMLIKKKEKIADNMRTIQAQSKQILQKDSIFQKISMTQRTHNKIKKDKLNFNPKIRIKSEVSSYNKNDQNPQLQQNSVKHITNTSIQCKPIEIDLFNHSKLILNKNKNKNQNRNKTETDVSYVLQHLKSSKQQMKSIYLPELQCYKQQLNQKMKEKKSFIQLVNGHINDITRTYQQHSKYKKNH